MTSSAISTKYSAYVYNSIAGMLDRPLTLRTNGVGEISVITSIVFTILPIFPVVLIVALIIPVSPLPILPLITTALTHPQEGSRK